MKTFFLFVVILISSCVKNTDDNHKLSLNSIVDDDVSDDTFSDTISSSEGKIVATAQKHYKKPSELEYECYKSVFQTTVTRTKENHDGEIFDINNKGRIFCVEVTFQGKINGQVSINETVVWQKKDFDDQAKISSNHESTMTKIVKLPNPSDGNFNNFLKIELKGKPGEKITINIRKTIPKDGNTYAPIIEIIP